MRTHLQRPFTGLFKQSFTTRPILFTTSRLYSTPSAEPQVYSHSLPLPTTRGRITILTLNRPSARNAISRQLLTELRTYIDSIAAEYDSEGNEVPEKKVFGGAAGESMGPTRALILTSGVDESFCAGADLKERKEMSADETAAFLANLRNTFTALSALPIPTISAVSSLALGGGLELALCTHLRVFASTAQVGLPETRLGIIPGAGGTYRLPGLIGLSRARDLILTGRRVTAAEAYFLGIADRLVEIPAETQEGEESKEKQKEVLKKAREEALREAVVLAGQICEGGPIAIRAALKAVEWAREEVENKMYERVVGSEDRNEALAAFREKRKPVFTGR
ncbi:ClpP/crotonase-like domain-containing protein [Xylogone sp. PMI_703]|nr:ClpP/crotonase-like domain-containing protein [Xylogone sp. PMI_703]